MNRYIVLYKAPLDARERLATATPAEAEIGMRKWGEWGQGLGDALVDPGGPLGSGAKVTTAGRTDGNDDIVGITILAADSMDHALELVGPDHHHLGWADGCEILVLEQIPIPELG